MDEMCRLFGLVLPVSATMLRLKVAFGGTCGAGAGLLSMASGPDGSLAWGTLMAVCGLALIGIAGRILALVARRETGDRERSARPCAATETTLIQVLQRVKLVD
jgi:hypothetical protein